MKSDVIQVIDDLFSGVRLVWIDDKKLKVKK